MKGWIIMAKRSISRRSRIVRVCWCFMRAEIYRITEYHLLKICGEKPSKNRLPMVILRSVVYKMPSVVHLRAEVWVFSLRSMTLPCRLRRRKKSKSSQIGSGENPPSAWNISVRTKMVWSPYTRLRYFARQVASEEMTLRGILSDSICRLNAPPAGPVGLIFFFILLKLSGVSLLSACMNRRRSPVAFFAPAFICRALPVLLVITWVAVQRATETVVSVLPPSATIISCGFKSEIEFRLSSKIRASLRVGMTTDTFNVSGFRIELGLIR